jgi:superfamily I DNA/RNA helicase
VKRFELARRQAKELRLLIGIDPEGLLEKLEGHIKEKYEISLWPVSPEAIKHGWAEAVPEDLLIRYDRTLKVDGVILAIAHELGHLARHGKLFGPHAKPDVLYDSKYTVSDGAGAIARYSRRDALEMEATAFAKEFTCPSDLLFDDWKQNFGASSVALAEKWRVSEALVRMQLAEALFDLYIGNGEAAVAKEERKVSLKGRQRDAVECVGKAVIVDAGPGTGKTETLIARVEFLLRRSKTAVTPDQILILTFSNEAADELRERISQRFDEETATAIDIHTFHSFGYSRLLTDALGLPYDITIIDEIGQDVLVNQLLGEVNCDSIVRLHNPGETAQLATEQINFLKDRGYGEIDLERAINSWKTDAPNHREEQNKAQNLLNIFQAYEQAKRAGKKADFADLILAFLDTLSASPRLVKELREKYRWIMVDEFQDVSAAMVKLLGWLCGPENPPWVVGDRRQAIYRFRGADPEENIRLFIDLFPQATSFDLNGNFRACAEVIEATNQMATLLASPEHDSADFIKFWEQKGNHSPFGELPVQILRSSSDAAEQHGIATLLKQWIAQGISPGEIAVLARRNVDVRNIVLALGRQGIKAVTSGLITPEGAAGDLAAVITLPDVPRASVPRVIFSLGRNRFQPDVLNRVITLILRADRNSGTLLEADHLPAEDRELIEEYLRLLESLNRETFSGDAFMMISVFLFDGSNYLRRILDESGNETAKNLMLSEIITTLTRAANHRFSNPKLPPKESRLSFAQHFRENISSSRPVTAPPRSRQDAVRVMTCHASKGLEFPCVIVAGQSLSTARRNWWLPPSLRPSSSDDRKQADAALFVGLTRAQRAVAVTYSDARSTGGMQRPLPDLLKRWREVFNVTTNQFPDLKSADSAFRINTLWDKRERSQIAARKLDKSGRHCDINTWLEEFVGIRFPLALKSLYPAFFDAVRKAMWQVIEQAHKSGLKVSQEEAELLFLERCNNEEFMKHPHAKLYQRIGSIYVKRFAGAYDPQTEDISFPVPDEMTLKFDDECLPVRLDLISYYQDKNGVTHAILYRPESLAAPAAGAYPTELNWSAIKDTSKKISLVMLRSRFPNIRFKVFSATDSNLYNYKPHRSPKSMDEDASTALARLRGFSSGDFVAQVDEDKCDSCATRISCPHWLGASIK